jgi:DNA-binding NtrC family response regulator
LDMRMPGLDGVDTFKSIRQCCPHAVGIFMTAYTTWHRTDDALREGGLAVLPKPLQLESLCQLISQVVHEQREARG